MSARSKIKHFLTGRGCPYNCSFCFKGIVGRAYHQRSPEDIVAEARHLVVIKKTARTPDRYPRRTGIPAKRPLREGVGD